MATNIAEAVILVVEDNPDNLFIVTDILKNDLQVKYVNARASGRQMFMLISKHPDIRPDLILLDIQLPYEDGYTILGQIRAYPSLKATKVIAFTSNVLPEDVERCRAAGFHGFIGKPINIHRFPEQIQRILGGESVWEAR